MPEETLKAAFGTPAILNQSDGGVAYVLAVRAASSAAGICEGVEWYAPTDGPSITCTATLHRVSDQVLLASQDFTPLAAGWVPISLPTTAIEPGVSYAFGVRTNRYTASTTGTVPPSAFPYSNGLHLSASGGSFDLAPSGVVFPGTLSTTLFFVSPVIDINTTSKVNIFVSGLRRLGALAKKPKPILIRNTPLPVAAQRDVRYRFSSFGRKWRINMFTDRVDSTSTARVQATVEADADGLPYDPTAATVDWAFLTSTLEKPQAGDWKTGNWDVTRIGSYVAQCNVGPAGVVELQPGNYYAWIRITDPAAGENPVDQLGKLIVT